jgi:hypothetical protein
MGKASSNKKVARAAGTGGGRTAGVSRPYGWYGLLAFFVVVGVFLVVLSRNEQQAAAAIHPRGNDHWHAAYAIDLCGVVQPNLPQNSNLVSGGPTPPPGIHTHGDGLIHIEPFVSLLSSDAGVHATVARFAADYPGFKLTSTEIQYPGQQVYKNGQKCKGKVSQVRIRVWDKANGSTNITYTNPADVHLKNGQAITIAFLPATDDIPKPPVANLNALLNPTEGSNTGTVPSTLPVATTPGATTPGATTPAKPATTVGGTASSVPASTPATVARNTATSTPPSGAAPSSSTPSSTP